MSSRFTIAFVDHVVHGILKSFDVVRAEFPESHLFVHESELLEFMEEHQLDLVLMNLDLIPNDAIHLLKEIKSRQNPGPFLVIYTLNQDDFVQELAFNSGADSFISFHNKPNVLKLFVRNLLHRRNTPEAIPKNKGIILDSEKFLVYRNGEAFQLPRKDFMLFQLLYTNCGRFLSKAEIAEMIWKDPKIAVKRVVDVHVYNIRQFFGKRIIQSQKGKGYRINKRLIA